MRLRKATVSITPDARPIEKSSHSSLSSPLRRMIAPPTLVPRPAIRLKSHATVRESKPTTPNVHYT
jgi:hypothetical protein